MSTVSLIVSGKGGVGKSSFASGLGIALASFGQRVCLVDTDIGLRGLDTFLGLQDRIIYDFQDVMDGNCTLDDALMPYGENEQLCLLPAPQFSRVKEFTPRTFSRMIRRLHTRFDRILIDCPAGIEKGLRLSLKAGADEVYLILTPDDLCIRDAERVMSILDEKGLPRPRLIVNRVVPPLLERGEMLRPEVVAQTLDTELFGVIPDDQHVYRAQLMHVHFMYLDCDARDAMLRIARRTRGENVPIPEFSRHRSWLARLIHPGAREVVRLDR